MAKGPLTSPRVEVADSLEAVYQEVCQRGWGDGLPVVPPTEDRVERMLEYVGRPPGEVVATLSPGEGEATVEKIAINAVMAGCLPEYLPVVIAAVEALAEPPFNLHSVQTTTNPVGPLLIINGPIRKKLDINGGRGCLGPGWRANATIGRAIRLILINIGAAAPAVVDKAIHGMPGKFTFCCGEDEEASPYEPLHVERGFRREESTVTVTGVQGTSNVLTIGTAQGADFLRLAANALAYVGNNNMVLGAGEPLFILTSGHAAVLAQQGFSKADCKRYLWERARAPEAELSMIKAPNIRPRVIDGKIVPCRSPEDIMIIVAGGQETYHLVVCPTFGDTRAVTKPIRSPGYRL